MKIVVLEGSPNKDGSSNLLATKFIRGAKEGGHSVQVIDAAHEDIHPCPVFESERRGHGAWDRMRNSQYDSVF
ncbi:NAD(P)H-dependent oxidoreductase [Dorea acetigenes]|uniref:NAD(P)H-dependent oxidoreductase n=1 Tax=Dorea acetigenes TaxID=2981787 RepID=A0ABT2RSF9_9FIRM|nr:NAD(P)H-dependent oxidoreductase [Dorea acetigenes]MCU6688353.1 NAD(P)H-dependent oxidoreductase [Dorea acetigenes]